MKSAGVVIGFVPLIVYGVLAGYPPTGPVLALAAATVASVVFGYADLRKRMILSWANFVLFALLLLATGLPGMSWIIPYNGVLIYASLSAVTFGSIVLGTPFTLQYARQMVERELWENPFFIRVNVLMTGVWGGVFLINFLLDAIALRESGGAVQAISLITYGVLGAGIVFTLWYPRHIQKKAVAGRPPLVR